MASTSGAAHADAFARVDGSQLTFATLKKMQMLETKECADLKSLVTNFAHVQDEVYDKLGEAAEVLRADDAFAGGEGTSARKPPEPLLGDAEIQGLVESAAAAVSLQRSADSLRAAMSELRRTYPGLPADNVEGTDFKGLLEGIESRSPPVDPKQTREFKDLKRKIMAIQDASRQQLDDDDVVVATQAGDGGLSGVANTKCPISGKELADIDEPVMCVSAGGARGARLTRPRVEDPRACLTSLLRPARLRPPRLCSAVAASPRPAVTRGVTCTRSRTSPTTSGRSAVAPRVRWRARAT